MAEFQTWSILAASGDSCSDWFVIALVIQGSISSARVLTGVIFGTAVAAVSAGNCVLPRSRLISLMDRARGPRSASAERPQQQKWRGSDMNIATTSGNPLGKPGRRTLRGAVYRSAPFPSQSSATSSTKSSSPSTRSPTAGRSSGDRERSETA